MRLFLIVFIFFFSACGPKTGVPKEVLPVPKMTDVLWDVMRAEELVNLRYPLDTGTVRFDTSIILYSQVAEAHNTTQAQFKQSLDFYRKRPDLMKVILDTLNSRTELPADTSSPPALVPVE